MRISQVKVVRVDPPRLPPPLIHVFRPNPRALQFGARNPAATTIRTKPAEVITTERMVVDFNHLLAGKILYLEVKILSIQRIPVT